jgi:pimeloyl-ACP methyl ester carboxylesterase
VRRRLARILHLLWIAAGLSLTAWLYFGFQAEGVPDEALQSDQFVAVAPAEHGMDFRVLVNPQHAGVIFLPGGMVEPVADSPLLKRIAAAGYPARLLYLPMRCACTDSQVRQLFERIRQVVAFHPETSWVLAGHSRGAMLAARFVHENPGADLAALALLGTTHPRDVSLTGVTMPIMKIYGTRDGVAGYGMSRDNGHLLPAHTRWVAIEGGNHVQFGYYRHQLGDNSATISRAEQQAQVEAALVGTLRSVRPGG